MEQLRQELEPNLVSLHQRRHHGTAHAFCAMTCLDRQGLNQGLLQAAVLQALFNSTSDIAVRRIFRITPWRAMALLRCIVVLRSCCSRSVPIDGS